MKNKILYIGGYGRSGSTILEQTLAKYCNASALGEVRYVWERGYKNNQLCGCGEKFLDCNFWSNVIDKTLQDTGISGDKIIELWTEYVDNKINLIKLLNPVFSNRKDTKKLEILSEIINSFYNHAFIESGNNLLIDSSKVPQYAYLVSMIKNVDLHVVHLVRDSRAVAYSWQRKKIRPEIHWKKEYMPTHNIFGSSIEWNLINLGISLKKKSYKSYTLMRYEDFVADPLGSVKIVQKAIGISEVNTSDINSEFTIKKYHTVSGNPIRFKNKNVKIIEDNEWKHQLPFKQKAIVSFLTMPLLLAYGYKL